jgi:hypothetical protein
MTIKESDCKAITLCNFGNAHRRTVLQKHLSENTAKKSFKRIQNIYHGIHGWRVWQETFPDQTVINDTIKNKTGEVNEKQ